MFKNLRKRIVDVVASRHIAGPDLNDALVVCRWAKDRGIRSIISLWADSKDPAREVISRFCNSAEMIKQENLDSYLSVKLEAIGYDFGLFSDLIDVAHENNVRVHLDSLGPDSAPVNFDFLKRAKSKYDNLGCTLPARWRRSLDDADLAVELGLSVRIVKGQWIDPNAPRLDCRKNYLAIASRLAGRALHVGVATHESHLAEKALSILLSSNTQCESEQFFSLPLNGIDVTKKLGCPYRIYIAYGYPGVPYNVRFTLSRPSIIAWMITDFAFKPRRPWATTSI